MKKVWLILILAISLATTLNAKEQTDPYGDIGMFLSGKYNLIGERPQSHKTYRGIVTLQYKNAQMHITREIDGETSHAVGKISKSIVPESPITLDVTFTQEGHHYQVSYIWHTEYDNYPRITGKIHLENESSNDKGFEALFAIW